MPRGRSGLESLALQATLGAHQFVFAQIYSLTFIQNCVL
jgi:hypothetical protein